jgi:hypothetical protein
MLGRLSRKGKVVGAVLSVVFVATAFTGPAGCTVSLDPQLLQQVLGWVQDYAGSGYVNAQWSVGPTGSDSPGGPCQDDDGPGPGE